MFKKKSNLLIIILVILFLFASGVIGISINSEQEPETQVVEAGCDVNSMKDACSLVNIDISCPQHVCPSTVCHQKDLTLEYKKLNYSFDEQSGNVVVSGVDRVTHMIGGSMLPSHVPDQIVFWQKFNGNYRSLSVGMVVLVEKDDGKEIAHAIQRVYSDKVLAFGINNYRIGSMEKVVETFRIDQIKYVEGRASTLR